MNGTDYYDNEYEGFNDHMTERFDREYERGGGNFIVLDYLKKFITDLYEAIVQCNMEEMTRLYEYAWPQLIEQHFKSDALPSKEEVSGLVAGNTVFLILYQELYFRHIHSNVKGGATLEERFESYHNYCDLFNNLLSNRMGPVKLHLPNQWLWEIIDEYIYQYQEFQNYTSRIYKEGGEQFQDLETHFKKSPRTWQAIQIINVLQSFVDKSNIKRQLQVLNAGGNTDSVSGEYGREPLYKMMGYFSLIGLLRLNSMFGDYYQAIKSVEHIEFYKMDSLFSRVPGCNVSMYYYLGFAYLMMRRYSDAIRTFSSILIYIQRTKEMFQTKSYQNIQINKRNEQMLVLLTICVALHPTRLDDSLQSVLFATSNQEYKKETNYSEKLNKMQAGDLTEFESCFMFACPKFLSPVPPNLDEKKANYLEEQDNQPTNSKHKEALRLQQQVFMDEVKHHIILPTIRSLLKLYTSMPIDKLAKYICTDKEHCTVDALESNLLKLKHKMMNLVWTKGTSGLEGEFQAESEVDFYIDKNMIHIADTKVDRRYGDFFIRQIHKFEELNRSLKAIKM